MIFISRFFGNLISNRTYHGCLYVISNLQSSTSSTTLPPGGIRWDWGAIFNSTDFHAGSGKGSDSGLATWSWGLLFGTTSGSDFDVKCGNAEFFASNGNVLGGLHSSVRRVFISIGLDLHTTGNSGDGFFSGQISNVNKSIVIRSVQVADSENVFSFGDLWAEFDDLFFFNDLLFWCHAVVVVSVSST